MSAVQAQYPTSKAKLVMNFIIAGFLLLIGIPLTLVIFEESANPLGWVGLVTALAGIAFIVFTFRRNTGRTLAFYDDRVELQTRGETQSWTYDSIDGIRIPAGKSVRHGRVTHTIKYYEFLANGERALTIPPVYSNWDDAGQRLTFEVKKRLVEHFVERINAGEDVVFDLKSANLGRGIKLKLNAQGITNGDDALIPWSIVKSCGFHPNDPGLVVVDTSDKNQAVAFRYYGSINSMVAADAIRALFA